ncbi:MAG: hypothetical protein ACK4Y5_15370 [Acetobacteraceae bacterium]|jgi:hypothetical protein
MSDVVTVNEALVAARAEIDNQLQYNSQQMGRMQAKRGSVSQDQKDKIDVKVDNLAEKNIELRDAWLANVAKILNLGDLVGSLKEQTKKMDDEAKVIGGVVTMLKTADALVSISSATVELVNGAPKK